MQPVKDKATKKKLITYFETLRACGALAVVMIHVIAGWYSALPDLSGVSVPRLSFDLSILQLFIKLAVPVFFMITGALLLDPDRDMPVKKLKRYIIRILLLLLTFGWAFAVIESIVQTKAFSASMLLTSFVKVWEGNSWSHMWYLYTLIGLYILTPVLRSFVRHAGNDAVCFVWIALIVLTSAVPTINSVTGLKLDRYVPISSVGVLYFLTGYLTARVPEVRAFFKKWAVPLSAAAAVLFLGGTLYASASAKNYALSDALTAPSNLFVFVLAACLLYGAGEWKWAGRLGTMAPVRLLSKYSLGIYILHPVCLNLLNKGLRLYPDFLPAPLGELAFWAAAFLSALAGTFVLSKLPGFRRIIV